jgi:hypothetical protein
MRNKEQTIDLSSCVQKQSDGGGGACKTRLQERTWTPSTKAGEAGDSG